MSPMPERPPCAPISPQVRIVTLKDAGHWLHADAPEAVAETLVSFLGAGR